VTERTLRGAAAIVGVHDAASPTGVLDDHGRALEARMIKAALDDAGLSLSDVDGVTCAGAPAGLAEYLGIHPKFFDGTQVGGSSFELHVEHAAAAIAAGLCDVVIGVYAATPKGNQARMRAHMAAGGGGGGGGFGPGRGGPPGGMGGPNPGAEWELPYGLRTPMGAYALAASRHMYEYGTTAEQLAQIAVDTRRWAAMNPSARFQDLITIDDVLDSPMQASPLHLLDCCLVTDGAGAFVMTSAERAAELAKPPVYVLGAASCGDHSMISQMPDLTTTAGASRDPTPSPWQG
jgi:acetyl-CoA acetyltransferase